VRVLQQVATQLTRIADALERAHPARTAPEPNSVEVMDVDLKMMRHIETIERMFWGKHGRLPDADEAAAEYEQVKHLLD